MYTPSNITNPDQIHKELEEIQSFLESEYAADVGEQVQKRFDSLAAYMARSGKLKADAELHLNEIVESGIMKALKTNMEEKLSPAVLNKYIDAVARNYKFLVTWADRVNRSCSHQHDGMRSVMSTLRSERFAYNATNK